MNRIKSNNKYKEIKLKKVFPTLSNIWKCLNRNSNTIIAIGTILGLILVFFEFKEFRKQNNTQHKQIKILNEELKYLQAELRQAYRPLGIIYEKEIAPGTPFNIYKNEEYGYFYYEDSLFLRNYGQGILSYIGAFFVCDSLETSLRNSLLNGSLDSVGVDTYYSYMRRITILPVFLDEESKTKIKVSWAGIKPGKKYFHYLLIFYEDQDGNLYDTEYLAIITYDLKNERKIPHGIRATYNYYAPDVRVKLVNAIKNLKSPKDHPLAEIIEK